MGLLINISLFGFACVLMWFASELIIRGVEHLAKNIRVSYFVASFLVLGILTSTTEISVGLNAVIDKKPEIFVGNLIGASIVILLVIIPIMAIFNNGIIFSKHFNNKQILFFLLLISAPALVILDGEVSRYDGLLLILLYGMFFYIFRGQEKGLQKLKIKKLTKKTAILNLAKIVFGGVLIYFASYILVDKTIYVAQFLKIPTFILSLLLLAFGTNLPELTIAFKSVASKNHDIALGDYIGSAASNTLLFGILTLAYGSFPVEPNGFRETFIIVLIGFGLFYFFFQSKNRLSAMEGIILLLVYIIFLLFQSSEILMNSPVI